MICPYCKEAELKLISECEPWYPDHYQCPECDSTYPLEDFE